MVIDHTTPTQPLLGPTLLIVNGQNLGCTKPLNHLVITPHALGVLDKNIRDEVGSCEGGTCVENSQRQGNRDEGKDILGEVEMVGRVTRMEFA